MDYHTNHLEDIAIVQDPLSLTPSDLAEEYQKMSAHCLKQKGIIDKCMQQNYTLKQEKALKDSILQEELQVLAENNDRELADAKRKFTMETEDLQNRLKRTKESLEKAEAENECLKSDLKAATRQPQENPSNALKTCNENETIVSNKRMEHLEKIETERDELMDELAALRSDKSQLKQQITELEHQLKDSKEFYECSQENLKYKSEALEEANNINETMQEKIILMEQELASVKSANDDHNKKGNSLFAEVDDQRQHMREILRRQKQQYETMKQKYEQSNAEIRRLQRENVDIHNEIQECAKMFKTAEKYHLSKLSEQIGFLKTENTRLTNKLQQYKNEMEALATTKGTKSLTAMMEYCESQTKDLNAKLMSYGMKKAEVEGQYFLEQERAAKWRFEALKSRCVLLDREMLLETNNIPFEKSLPNMRQRVNQQFGANEEPLIDGLAQSNASSVPHNPSHSKPLELNEAAGLVSASADDSGWSDVREIIASRNQPVISPVKLFQRKDISTMDLCGNVSVANMSLKPVNTDVVAVRNKPAISPSKMQRRIKELASCSFELLPGETTKLLNRTSTGDLTMANMDFYPEERKFVEEAYRDTLVDKNEAKSTAELIQNKENVMSTKRQDSQHSRNVAQQFKAILEPAVTERAGVRPVHVTTIRLSHKRKPQAPVDQN